MTQRFFDLTFTDSVKQAQEENGSRNAYARMDGGASTGDSLTEQEIAFVSARDSFYMGTVSETGWPYVQHRGGPKGFVKVLGPSTLGIADFRGNRQYLSLGNLRQDDRTSLFFMDYPSQARLKILAHARAVDLSDHPDIRDVLVDSDYGAKVERGLLFEIEGYDWNCPQHITKRYTRADLEPVIVSFQERITELEAEVARLKGDGS